MSKEPRVLAEAYADERCGKWEDCENENEWEEAKRGFMAGYESASQQWTSVLVSLPESSDSYILVTQEFRGHKQVEYAKFKNGAWYVSGTGEVTHWMPLPKPPEDV